LVVKAFAILISEDKGENKKEATNKNTKENTRGLFKIFFPLNPPRVTLGGMDPPQGSPLVAVFASNLICGFDFNILFVDN